MAYNAVIQLPALFDVEGGAAALFGEQQVSDVMNSHLLFSLDRQAKIGNGHVGYRVPDSNDVSSLVDSFKETFLVGDTVAENYDSGKTNDTSLLGNGLFSDLGAVHTADVANLGHPVPTSNITTGTFGTPEAPLAIHWQDLAPYKTSPNFLSNSATSVDIADVVDAASPYYYDDSDGLVKGGASCILHYEDGALKSIEMVSGGSGYKIGDTLQIAIPASVITGGAALYKITLTKNSVNVDGGKMKFYVNMLGNSSGKYLPKYSEGTGQIASPNDVVDDFCNKFADSLIKAYTSGYVNVPHPEKAIPMGGRAVTNGKAPLYPGTICPEASEKAGLGTSMARAAAVHLVGHPLAQALFSNENGIEAELTAAIQEEHSKDYVAGDWDADLKYDGNKVIGADQANLAATDVYGEMGYGSASGGHENRVGKQGFRFKSKLSKILSKIFGGSQADGRKFDFAGTAVDNGEADNSLKAGNGNAQVYKLMKSKRSADGGDASTPYESVAENVTAPDCVRFAVEADVAATAPNFTNALKTIIDGTPHDHKGSVTDLSTLDLDQTGFIPALWNPASPQMLNGAALSELEYVSTLTATSDLSVTRNGSVVASAKDAQFAFLWERSAAADSYSVSLKSVTCVDPSKDLNNYSDATGGVGFQAGDELSITVETKVVKMVLVGENIVTPHIGNVDPHKIGADHVNGSALAAYNFMGVKKEDGVYNSILQSIYEQCLNVPGRATELDNGRNAVVSAVAYGALKTSTLYDVTDANADNHVGLSNVVVTEGAVYGSEASVVLDVKDDCEIQSQFTTGANVAGDDSGKITLTIANSLITKMEITAAGNKLAQLHAGDVLYVKSSFLVAAGATGATGDLEIKLSSANLTPDALQTGLWDGPYSKNVMLTRDMAGTHCIPTTFPVKAGDKLVTYLRPSLKLKFDKTLLDADVNVQYLKANGELETLNVDGIVNASADGEMGSISHTFPGMVYDLCEHVDNVEGVDGTYHTLQEWIDQDMQHTPGNFVGVRVANSTHAQNHKFCWMGSGVHAKSNNSLRANKLAADEVATPAHTLDDRKDAHLASVKISQQTTDEVDNTKLDLHVWKCTVSL